MQKVDFKCEDCEAEGRIQLPSRCDDHRITTCPCCGSSLDIDDNFDDLDD